MSMEETRGRELEAPVKHITLDGQSYALVFSNEAIRTAEDIYETVYHKDYGFERILQDIVKRKYYAVMAFFYGVISAGGSPMTWAEFDAAFRLDSVEGVAEIIEEGLRAAMPGAEAGEGDDPTLTPTVFRGRGSITER